MKILNKIGLLSMGILISLNVISQAPGENAVNPYAIPTYECAGVYWKTPESAPYKINEVLHRIRVPLKSGLLRCNTEGTHT